MKQLGLLEREYLVLRRSGRNLVFCSSIAQAVFIGVPSVIVATPSVEGFERNHLPEINKILERFELPTFETIAPGVYKARETTVKILSGALKDDGPGSDKGKRLSKPD